MPFLRNQQRRIGLDEIAADHHHAAVAVAQDQVVATARVGRPKDELAAGNANLAPIRGIEDFRAATEKEFLRRKLLEFGGNIKRTAENIDLQRSNLYKKLERYGLK